MTRNERLDWWRNLTFWQRLLLECSIWVGGSILINVVFWRSLDIEWIIGGFGLGIFYAIVDHAYFARPRQRRH